MPIFQARSGSRVRIIAGPRTPKTMPKREGVSMPNGMAVTSRRPVLCMRRTASQLYTRSPTRTPIAVPGTITRNTRSGGNPKTPMRRLDRMTSCVRLSSASPKKAFQSPGAYHRPAAVGATASGTFAGGRLGRTPRGRERLRSLPRQRANAIGQRRAPRELAPILRDRVVRKIEGRLLHWRAPGLAQPESHPVALAFARPFRLDDGFRAKILALRVR